MADYTALEDLELAALLAEGDEYAFAEIYSRYNSLLFIYAYKKLGDREEARDAVQEIFVTLWNNRAAHPMKSSYAGYLYRSVHNKALDLFAHKKIVARHISSLQHFLDQDPAYTDHPVREKEMLEMISREISALPPRMREVFELSRKDHLSHREIALKLNISEQTVTKQIKKALKVLRVKLGILVYLILLHG